jgi:hypothetical protein
MTRSSTTVGIDIADKVSYEIDKDALVSVNDGICIKGIPAEDVKYEDTL